MARLRMAVAAMTVVMMLSAGSGSALAGKGGQLGGVGANPTSISFGTVSGYCYETLQCLSSIYYTNNAPVAMRMVGAAAGGGNFYWMYDALGNPDQCVYGGYLAPGATCILYVGFRLTDSLSVGRYTGSFDAFWHDGARQYQVSTRLSVRVVGA